MIEEIWKPIIGFEYVYSISNFGRVRREMTHRNTIAGNILIPGFDKGGYLKVSLKNGKNKGTFTIHRLVSTHFIGLRPNGFVVNHKDCDKTNNHISNLEYVTSKENTFHAMKNNRLKFFKGSRHGQAKLNEKIVVVIHKMLASGISQEKIAKEHRVDPSVISRINTGNTWTHVEKQGGVS